MPDALRLSQSPHFRNKANHAPLREDKLKGGKPSNTWAYGAFNNVVWTPAKLVQHITTGHAICVASLTENWRKEANFASSQLMGVDFDAGPDIDGLLADLFVSAHALLVYRTPSWTAETPRTRALFALDAPLTDAGEYKRLLKRLLKRFDAADIDEQCKDAVRLFYGSDVKGFYDCLTVTLPLDTLRALPVHPDELPKPMPERKPATPLDERTLRRAMAYAETTKQNLLNEYVATPARTGERHKRFNALCLELISRAKGGWVGFNTVEQDLRWAGERMERDEDEIKRGIDGAWKLAEAMELTLPEDKQDAPDANSNPAPVVVSAAPLMLKAVNSAPAPQAPTAVTWHTSVESLDRYKESLIRVPQGVKLPLVFPFKCLWESKGFCRVVPPGVMIGVVGMSGGMKTSFVECLTDKWRQMDANDVLWWGPEWDWERMSDRAVQRYGGAAMEDKLLHTMWLGEVAANVPLQKRYGVEMHADVLQQSDAIADKLRAYPGQSHFIEQMDLDIETLLIAASARVHAVEAEGRAIRIAVFDYVQLLNMRSVRSEMERIGQVLGLLKAFCVEHQLIGVVASQVTKTSSKSARAGGETLSAEDGQFLRSDKFNVVLTLNPIYAGKLLTGQGIIRVAKNSTGDATVEKQVFINPARFMWQDKEVPDEQRVVIEDGEVVF